MLNACKTEIQHILSPSVVVANSSVGLSLLPHSSGLNNIIQTPSIAEEELAVSAARLATGGESALSGSLGPSPLLAASPRCLEQAPVRPPPVNSSASNFLGSLSSDVSEMLRTCDQSQATSKVFEVPENVLSQEFCTLLAMEDKSFDISFYRQNLFEYEQGLAMHTRS